MLRQESNLRVIDNTGARYARAIRKLGKNAKKISIGDVVVVHIIEATPNALIKKGGISRAVIVRTKYPFTRSNNSLVLFEDNAAVLVDNDNNPRGTRIFGPIPRELKLRNFNKLISIASEII